MSSGKNRVALIFGRPKENEQRTVIQELFRQTLSEGKDVCSLAVCDDTPSGDTKEKKSISCVNFDEFSTVIVIADTIQSDAVMKDISEALSELPVDVEVRWETVCGLAGEREDVIADILDRNLLVYFFQPIVDARTGEIFAYEALMRSNVKEPVSPLDIIKYAERTGRLNDVERATFLNILSYMEEHGDLFGKRKVFINSIPGTKVSEQDFHLISEKLQSFSGRVVVELTEQAEMDDEELASIKERYETLGIDTAVDDYGTGYSNVYNLLRYMPNVVKVDRMLLANIQLSAQKQHFVKEIVEFSHGNDIAVLAEGIETTEELKTVISLGVDYIQGYYTARPAAKVIPAIEKNIRNEIIQYAQYAKEISQRGAYQAGEEDALSLPKLVAHNYSKIVFSQEGGPHRDVLIYGQQGFAAGIEIEIADGYSGRIELRDVDLAVHNEQPVIRLGEGCDLTLALEGENILEQGGILVPESSKLTVVGDGNLLIKKIAINGYGIGNDKDSRHGELYFDQDGLIKIQGNTVHGVGIGAGYGGKITIRRGMYSIHLAGMEAVGIGSLYSDVDMSIHNCALEFSMRNAVNVGLGSLEGSVVLELSHIGLNGFFSADRCVGVGTIDGTSFKLDLGNATGEINAHADELCGIGSISGDVYLNMSNYSFNMTIAGTKAVAMGNPGRTAEIHSVTGDLILDVTNELDYDIGVNVYETVAGSKSSILNGRPV